MYSKCKEQGLHVRKEDVRLILSSLDPEGTEIRRSRRLNRRAYFTKGPNFVWHVDSYDKLKPFGICINGAIDGYSRRVLWLNAYCTSSDPKVIGGYFLETVRELGGCPCILRADMGTENSSIRDMQRYLHRHDDDAHGGDKSFIYGRSTSNQRIESWWGHLRKQCVNFWLEHLHRLKDEGEFDGEFLDKNLILFCFLGLIQDELDSTKECWNSHLIRPSILIQGSEASLHSFEEIFLLLKDEADKLETTSPEPDINAESTTTDSTVNTSEPPNTTPAPNNSTPVAPKYMEQMQETLALLEQDFTEFWELTMARLCEHSLSQQLRDEVCQVKRECRMALSEAMAELKELQEDNGALRAQLASFKEDMKLLEPS
ncbi:hypothetical protein SKAU_G00077760 [Synaphobranchus kaupii]|uniref:Integrase core domain-containing protein n=1 Tax=Synaphobranchus kaupii TaxID=118154 RepID=A0A9Q1G8X8_SYNKA|nr:hypothetical protein SKAU_G00077760 [Synaphobranchus kaupii]